MRQTLFVNYREEFINRMRGEVGDSALLTHSMLQGLRWLSNTELPIDAIYLNPVDSSYSALRFIELATIHRPATPVFLINDEGDLDSMSAQKLSASTGAKKIFNGSESYQDFLEPLQYTSPESIQHIKNRRSRHSEHPGYITIPLIDFTSSSHYPFDVFMEDSNQKLCLFASFGSPVDGVYLSHVAEKTSWLYVNEDSISKKREQLHITQNACVDLEHIPLAWRTAETLFSAKTLLHEIHNGGVSEQMIEQTQLMLTDVFHLVSHLSEASKLSEFIQNTKNDARAVTCAALSILMCKRLKFEKNAIVEILGLASILQDISLHDSPFGNLSAADPSTLEPEARKYYERHSLLSADLVAQATSLPDVTLQVMRQHHERKDRTGFPNRVGGLQLHPMAEILSLINSYLDHKGERDILDAEVYPHYSDRVVSTFKELVKVLDSEKTLEKTSRPIAA